jgi:hypothetical protein
MLNDDERELSRLEAELRSRRPEPRAEFLADLVSRVERQSAPARRAPRFRFGLAVAFAVVFVVAGAAFGALGYTTTAVRDTVARIGGIAEGVVKPSAESREGTKQSQKTGGQPARALGAGSAGAGVLAASDFSISTKSGHHQYPRFVVVCIQLKNKQLTIVIPRFLVPLFQHWIVNLGPCSPSKPPG